MKKFSPLSMGVIGVGAFGEFMLRHLSPYFALSLYDVKRDLTALAAHHGARPATLEAVCRADIVVIAAPVQQIGAIVSSIQDKLSPGQLLLDVASVKCLPVALLSAAIPQGVDIVSLHPLFGPQSGKDGIAGLDIAVVNVRGERAACVVDFLKSLDLTVFETTAEEHDRQMAYVMGLTHMIAKVFKTMDLPEMTMQTRTFSLLRQALGYVIDDSDELFTAIQRDNPFVDGTKDAFFAAVRDLEVRLHAGK